MGSRVEDVSVPNPDSVDTDRKLYARRDAYMAELLRTFPTRERMARAWANKAVAEPEPKAPRPDRQPIDELLTVSQECALGLGLLRSLIKEQSETA